MTEQELSQRAKELLIKYEFSDHALFDNQINLGVKVPKDLRAKCEKEYYEELAENYDSNEINVYQTSRILEYGFYHNHTEIVEKIYNKLNLYHNITDVEVLSRIIISIGYLCDSSVKSNEYIKTEVQRKWIGRLIDLAEEIYGVMNINKQNLPSGINGAFSWKPEEERKEMFINGLKKCMTRLRENRKIIGL